MSLGVFTLPALPSLQNIFRGRTSDTGTEAAIWKLWIISEIDQ